jgi:Na+/phosphate symporter
MIYRSDTEKYKSEMQDTTKSLEKLEKEFIRPYLIELSKLKISAPLRQDEIENSFERMSSLLDDLEKITDLAIKQRACQTLFNFVYQTIEFKLKSNSDTLELFTQTLEKQVSCLTLKDEKSVKKDESDNTHLKFIKKLVDGFFESKKDITSKEDMSLSDQIHKLKKYEATLKEKWNQDIQSCLDAIEEL